MATPNSFVWNSYTNPVQQQSIYSPLNVQTPKLSYTLTCTGATGFNQASSALSLSNGIVLYATGPGYGAAQSLSIPSPTVLCSELGLSGYNGNSVFSFQLVNLNNTDFGTVIMSGAPNSTTNSITVGPWGIATIVCVLNPAGSASSGPTGALYVN
jgi:hypothetical protein